MDESTLNQQPAPTGAPAPYHPSHATTSVAEVTAPAVGQESPAGWGAPAGFGPAPVGGGLDEPSLDAIAAAGAALRKTAFKQFGIAVLILVAGIALILWASGGNLGIIFYGPFIAGIALMVRAVASYRGSVRTGASSTSKDRGLLVGAGLVVVALLVGGIFAGTQLVGHEQDTHSSTGVGSCWKEQSDDNLVAVSCSHAHQYVGTAIVTDDSKCGTNDVGSVAADDGGRLCLAKS